jgi:hypothetical protein
MTDEEIEQAEKDATEDAKWLLLLLLLNKKRVTYRADVGRFYVDGKSVSITTVRDYISRIERRIGNRILKLTDDLEAGRITLDEWRDGFTRNITSMHILTGALALGSIAAAARNADIQKRIDDELKYANNFAKQIKNNDAGSYDRIRARAKSYTLAAVITFGIFQHLARKLMGVQTECRRVRRASESCSGCIAWSYRWMPIAQMPPIGSLDCGSRCRCYLEYR